MKSILNNLLYILTTIFIIIIIIAIILLIFEKIYSMSDEVKWNKENEIINNMNEEKLSNTHANYLHYIWKYKDEAIEQKQDKKRILVIGDSYIWGDGYSNANLIWWQQLRNKLLENGYNDVEVIAAGLIGYNTYQEYLMLVNSNILKKIKPDLIIFSYVVNDIEACKTPYDDNKIWIETTPNYDKALSNILPDEINSFFKFLYPNLYNKINNLLTDKYSNIKSNFGMSYYQYEKNINSNLFIEKYLENVLKPLKKYLDNYSNIPYLFVDIPFYTSDEHEQYFTNIKKQFDEQKIQFYDLLPDYKLETGDYDPNIYKINPSNGHPGTKTTEFSARKVLEILENNYQEVLGEKTNIRMNDIIINDPMPRNINLQKINYDTYTFNYPSINSKNSFLYMPINEKYIKLNFMYPVDLKNIEITGDNINDIDIYINKINEELGYDDQKMHHVTSNNDNIWNVNYNQVTSINLHIDIKNGDNSTITIKFIK